jgi:Zn-dependent protease
LDSRLDPATLAGVIVILLLSLSWHEAAHAWVADKRGDPTARSLGRVTLNPLKHLDPFLSVVLPTLMYMMLGVAFGGGKPVPINVMNFRNRARDFMLVALAGPFSNLLLALLFCVLYVVSVWTGILPTEFIPSPYGAATPDPPTMMSPGSISEAWLTTGIMINLLLALFNLIPVPPLDGSRVIGWLLPRGLQRYWYALDRIGIFVVLLLVFYMDVGSVIYDVVLHVYALLSSQVDALVWWKVAS